ncbi:hypothetical protein [Microbulbifer sp. Q7]|uniref:WD40/YVTN/BNR-like repeat-containing protein n=1 Tax=Microbulbifer sp. Q7 TaxID=1785091 RepID=UPI000AF35F4A|nr:hypothetical protein [Microbulbifer sp. Q7]
MKFLQLFKCPVRVIAISALLLSAESGYAASPVQPSLTWEYWAPGGGGEIQSIYAEPNVPGRFYVMSDMEGAYRSDDYGQSYRLLSKDLPQLNVFGMTSDPENPQRLYLGTHRMALKSNDAGDSWEPIPETLNYPIHIAGVHPSDSNLVLLALSSPDADDLNRMVQRVPEYADGSKHPGLVFVSRDGGKTFEKSFYDQKKKKGQNAWQLAFDEERNRIYLATERGLYFSADAARSWQPVKLPRGYRHALGIALDPTERFAFAVLSKNSKQSTVFSVDAEQLAANEADWVQVDQLYGAPEKRLAQPGETREEWDGESYTNPGQRYARLEIDPRSGQAAYGLKNTVRVLLGKTMKHHNSSLFMSSLDISKGVPTQAAWQRIYYEGGQKGWETSQGSDNYVQIDSFAFSPISWGEDAKVLLENGHGISLLDPAAKGFPKRGAESVLYQTRVEKDNGTNGAVTWRNRGFVNTYNNDFASYDNYAIAALADQGLHESWDHGQSWTRAFRPIPQVTASKSVEILETTPPIAVLASGFGYGAGDIPMGLFAKKLDDLSPQDKWVHLAGGIDKWTGEDTENAGGLPSVPKKSRKHGDWSSWDYRIWGMAADSQNPKRLFITFRGKGIYVCDDVPALLNGEGEGFRKLNFGEVVIPKAAIVAHPALENSFFVAFQNYMIFYHDDKMGMVGEFPGAVEDVAAWINDDHIVLAVAAFNPEDNSHNVYVSSDLGSTWDKLLDRARMKKVGVPKWFETDAYTRDDQEFPFMTGLAGYRDRLFVPVGSIRNNVGIYEIHLKSDSHPLQFDVRDITESSGTRHGYTRVNEGEVRWINGEPHLIHSTRGAGVVAASLKEYMPESVARKP